jgi:hypothetical protein
VVFSRVADRANTHNYVGSVGDGSTTYRGGKTFL